MTNQTENGSKGYLFSIVLVAVLGGAALRLRYRRYFGGRQGASGLLHECARLYIY